MRCSDDDRLQASACRRTPSGAQRGTGAPGGDSGERERDGLLAGAAKRREPDHGVHRHAVRRLAAADADDGLGHECRDRRLEKRHCLPLHGGRPKRTRQRTNLIVDERGQAFGDAAAGPLVHAVLDYTGGRCHLTLTAAGKLVLPAGQASGDLGRRTSSPAVRDPAHQPTPTVGAIIKAITSRDPTTSPGSAARRSKAAGALVTPRTARALPPSAVSLPGNAGAPPAGCASGSRGDCATPPGSRRAGPADRAGQQ
jgi:hypothetical protein